MIKWARELLLRLDPWVVIGALTIVTLAITAFQGWLAREIAGIRAVAPVDRVSLWQPPSGGPEVQVLSALITLGLGLIFARLVFSALRLLHYMWLDRRPILRRRGWQDTIVAAAATDLLHSTVENAFSRIGSAIKDDGGHWHAHYERAALDCPGKSLCVPRGDEAEGERGGAWVMRREHIEGRLEGIVGTLETSRRTVSAGIDSVIGFGAAGDDDRADFVRVGENAIAALAERLYDDGSTSRWRPYAHPEQIIEVHVLPRPPGSRQVRSPQPEASRRADVTVTMMIGSDALWFSVRDLGEGLGRRSLEELLAIGVKSRGSPGHGFGLYVMDCLARLNWMEFSISDADVGAVARVCVVREKDDDADGD